ncbi:MAG: response regulator [Bryobacteraceae bacterium]
MSKALVIDDSKAIRGILARILTALGYEVVEAVNGRAALDVVRHQSGWSLVLVDWNMPEMNGIDFVRAFRSAPEHSHIPLMMVTTETNANHMVTALEAGANDYIMKPFTGEVISEKLKLLETLNHQ